LSKLNDSRRWRFVAILLVFSLVAVACGGDTAEEEPVVEEVETTEAPATTAAEAEAASDAPTGVYKMAIFQDPATQNYWNWLDTETDTYSLYQMTAQTVSLFGISMPNYTLVASMATELVETNVDNGDGTWTYTVPIKQGYEWSDGNLGYCK
jgi:malonyl CoA-acyl carrier protein transacylase